MTVLVLTRRDDLTADQVVHHLQQRGAGVARMDLSEFPQQACFDAEITADTYWAGALQTQGWDIALEEVRAVYYRRPRPFTFPPGFSDADRAWCATEARHGLGGLLAALPHARWVNPVDRLASADRKPVQLATAAAMDLNPPATLLTNDPEHARKFVACQPHGAVYKSLRGGGPAALDGRTAALFTTPITEDQITPTVATTAHLFQARVPKAADVRVTSVGSRLFATKITSTSSAAARDFRADYNNLTYEPITVPEPVAFGLRALMHNFGLVYAAHDFVIDDLDTGTWHYLETNPNGQFWTDTDDIAAALADELTGETA